MNTDKDKGERLRHQRLALIRRREDAVTTTMQTRGGDGSSPQDCCSAFSVVGTSRPHPYTRVAVVKSFSAAWIRPKRGRIIGRNWSNWRHWFSTASGVLSLLWATAISLAAAASASPKLTFAVSMERPATHYYHVALRCEGLNRDTQDLKLPVWTPGYYRIMDYSKNILNFHAEDGNGQPLSWTKTAKNIWRVQTAHASVLAVNYDVYANSPAVADSYLDDERGYLSPASVFMHVAGQLHAPAHVTIEPFHSWTNVVTGLDPVPGQPNIFQAPDFDVLYDCPFLVGNLETLTFEVQGVPHRFVGANLGTFDRAQFTSDLQRMVTAAVAIIGDIPYRHYTFLVAGSGPGGIEHLNSAAIGFNGAGWNDPVRRKKDLSFLAHEFFHLYNVKRIRPIELGPFDYDRENYTRLLWVSEGFTVYYEWLILARAGLYSRDDVLSGLQTSIAAYEKVPGHRIQTATEASWDTWLQPAFSRAGANTANTSISYYDKGAALGLLLDFAIRHQTKNQKSLDDVMRTLYREFYQGKKRGFTEEEFRVTCEKIAGGDLTEIFEGASTLKDLDYPRLLAYGGLTIEMPHDLPEAYWGMAARDQDGKLMISSVTSDSPAAKAGLSEQDEIVAVDGARMNADRLAETLKAHSPGDQLRVMFSRHNKIQEATVTLAHQTDYSFRIQPAPNPDPLQSTILEGWLKPQTTR